MILLDALYINNSGGKVLLDQLVHALFERGTPVVYLLDQRVKGEYPFLDESRVFYLEATLPSRKSFYQLHQTDFKTVLCFGNIPPPVRLKAEVYTYFHQLLYLETPSGMPWMKRILTYLKSWYVRFYKHNTDFWLVQTSYGKSLLSRKFSVNKDMIQEYPFFADLPPASANVLRSFTDFLYVSDGNPHKNHLHLLEAWRLVNSIHPTWVLHLTVSDQYPLVLQKINQLISEGLNIQNHGRLSRQELAELYQYCAFFVFPSLTESLGLPLVEACHYRCKILAPDLEYSKSVVRATDYFNPDSPKDIAETILKNAALGQDSPDSILLLKNSLAELCKRLED